MAFTGQLTGKVNTLMFGPILVFAVAVSIVVTYMLIVNRFLRSDRHWNEAGHDFAPSCSEPAPATATVAGPAFLTPKHI